MTVSKDLLNDLLPGPVTVIFERTSDLNPDLNAETSLIGIRIPDHEFIMALAAYSGGPIALTSANISSEKSTLNVEVGLFLAPLAKGQRAIVIVLCL